MWIDRVFVALWALVKQFNPGVRKPTSPSRPTTRKPLPKSLPATRNNVALGDPQDSPPKAGEHPKSGESDGIAGGNTGTKKSQKKESEPRKILGRRGRHPKTPGSKTQQLSPSRPTTRKPLSGSLPATRNNVALGDPQDSPPKAGEHPKSGESDGIAGGNTGTKKSQKKESEPRKILGRQGRQPKTPGSKTQQLSPSRPTTGKPLPKSLPATRNNVALSDPQDSPPKAGEHPKSGESDGIAGGNTGTKKSQKKESEPRKIPERQGRQPKTPGSKPQQLSSSRPTTRKPLSGSLPATRNSVALGDPKDSPPKAGEHPKSGESDSNADGNTGTKKSQKKESEPRKILGRRGRQPKTPGSKPQQLSSSRLVCRKSRASSGWEIVLCADKKSLLSSVSHDGTFLKFTGQECRISSFTGCLAVSYQGGHTQDIPLCNGEPLIFKLRKNWAGEGHNVSMITNGHFIVIALERLERKGHAPVEPDGCTDKAFRAHYCYRDATAPDDGAEDFLGWGIRSASGIELNGWRVFDDSDEGDLFAGDAPDLKSSPDIVSARVGEEAERGWGQNFSPDKEALSEVLNGREGCFFLRVYNSQTRLLDSVVFRHLRNLRQICVDGVQYSQDTVFVPGLTGYPRTEVHFVGADDSTLWPILPVEDSRTAAPSGVIEIPPHPCADHISCRLGSDVHGVNIALDLPRIWWRLEDSRSDPGEWRDTPLVMTRDEFRKHAYHSKAKMSILSKRFKSVYAGFDDRLNHKYDRTIGSDCISISLADFVDHAQIDRRLDSDAHFKVEWARKILTLIRVTADSMPEIVAFTAAPSTIVAGEEVTLEWETRNAGEANFAIEPDVGTVERDGKRSVRPGETTTYTLTLTVSGISDISRDITIAVESSPELSEPDKQAYPRVMSAGSGWKTGKGFSVRELRNAGLTMKEAVTRSIPIDGRRRTSHQANVETIRSMLNA